MLSYPCSSHFIWREGGCSYSVVSWTLRYMIEFTMCPGEICGNFYTPPLLCHYFNSQSIRQYSPQIVSLVFDRVSSKERTYCACACVCVCVSLVQQLVLMLVMSFIALSPSTSLCIALQLSCSSSSLLSSFQLSLNTVLLAPGSHLFSSHGVDNYRSQARPLRQF